MLALTLGGLFIVSALIGVLANGIDTKLADLRRGRSIVLEKDHTVILGWSESIFTIISELTLANESRKDPVIVILADRDKVDMEDELKVKVPERRGTRVVCRSGSPDGHRRPAAEQPRDRALGDPAGARLRRPGLRGHQDAAGAHPQRRRRAADRRRDPGPRATSRPRAGRQGPDHAARHPGDGRQARRPDLAAVRRRRRLHRAVRLRGRRVLLLRGPRPGRLDVRRGAAGVRGRLRGRHTSTAGCPSSTRRPETVHHRRADAHRGRRGRLGARGPVPVADRAGAQPARRAARAPTPARPRRC